MSQSYNKIKKLTIVIGASEESNIELNDPSSHFVVFDARDDLLQTLANQHGNANNLTLSKAIVTPEWGRSIFYHYSLPEFSSTLKPNELKTLLPGIKLTGSEFVSGLSLVELMSDQPAAKVIELRLNVPGQELALLRSLSGSDSSVLADIDRVIITSCEQPLYENGNTVDELNQWLEQKGFELIATNSDEFSLVQQTWELDKKQQLIDQLRKERDEAVARVYDASKELEQLKQQLTQITERAETAEVKSKELESSLEAANAEKEKHVARVYDASKELDELKAENRSLNQALEILKSTLGESQNQLIQKMDDLKSTQEQSTQQVTQAIKNQSQRTTKHVQGFLGLQQFWQTGELLARAQTDNLGLELKQFLIEKLTNENYDAILQFGGNDICLFMAKVLQKTRSSYRQLTSEESKRALDFKNRTDSGKPALVKDNESDQTKDYETTGLPADICVFEHNVNKLKQLEKDARKQMLSSSIEFKHTPLVDYHYHGDDYLHYDCDETLAQLKSLLHGRSVKLLVVVSGPQMDELDHLSFPAVPKVLNSLSQHEIHVVTDNYHDKGAKEVAVMWSKLFDQRELSVEKRIIADDRSGFAWLINRESN